MKKFFLTMVAIISVSALLYAQSQNIFNYSPSKPTSEDEIQIQFNPVGTSLEKVKNLDAEVMFLSNKLDFIKTVHFTKEGNNWSVKIKPESTTTLIALKLVSDLIEENNGGQGYIILLNDKKGKTLSEAFACKALLFKSVGILVGIDSDVKLANKTFEEAFKIDPIIKIKFLSEFIGTLYSVISDKDLLNKRIKEELTVIEDNNNLTDDDYYTLYYWYTNILENEKAKSFIKLAVDKYPKGKLATEQLLYQINAENDFNKKKNLIDKFFTEFQGNENMDNSVNQIFLGILGQNKFDDALSLLEKYPGYFSPYHYVNLAEYMVKANCNIDTTSQLALQSVGLAKSELNNPTKIKPKMFSDFLWLKTRETTLAVSMQTYAEVLMKLNKISDAIKYYKESFNYIYSKWLVPQFVIGYLKLLTHEKQYDNAIDNIKKFIVKGVVTDEIKDLLKQNYIGKNGSDSGFENFLTETLNAFKKELIERLKTEIFSEPAPQFSLYDLEGKNISLLDYKGKVIVLDFWATWCSPCIASFPAMKLAKEKFEPSGNVKFLFINTQETSENKRQYVSDFMTKKGFAFHVLLDEKNEVLAKYKVVGVPTKFVIDKNGKIRFKSSGYYSKPDEFIEEIGAMISLAEQ